MRLTFLEKFQARFHEELGLPKYQSRILKMKITFAVELQYTLHLAFYVDNVELVPAFKLNKHKAHKMPLI